MLIKYWQMINLHFADSLQTIKKLFWKKICSTFITKKSLRSLSGWCTVCSAMIAYWAPWVFFAGILSRYCRKPRTWTKFSSTRTGRGVHWRPQRNIMWFPAVLRLTSPVIKSPGRPPPPQPQVRCRVLLCLLSCVYSSIIGLILLLKTNFCSLQFYFAIYSVYTDSQWLL